MWPGFGFCKAVNPGRGQGSQRGSTQVDEEPVSVTSLASAVHGAAALALPWIQKEEITEHLSIAVFMEESSKLEGTSEISRLHLSF